MVKSQKKKPKDKTSKIVVGTDEFCSKCMEWQEYDENGKCKVCGKLIKKTKTLTETKDYDNYKLDDISDISEIEEDNSY